MAGNEPHIILGLLNEVQRNNTATQRVIAKNLGVALGLANAYLKRCIKKGYVKVSEAPANRYAYYLTPSGFAEKARLTADYLTQSFGFFRTARAHCDAVIASSLDRGFSRLALIGASELGEIMVLCAHGTEVDLVGVIDPALAGGTLAGMPVMARREDLPAHDALVVTSLVSAQSVYDDYVGVVGRGRILAPQFLGISVEPLVLAE
ncbi:conserved hypothetical protein [Candidatus Terasakiella magnetica]|nr:conserved hypothetical protein [Candidatus Terasakiella magnetica]